MTNEKNQTGKSKILLQLILIAQISFPILSRETAMLPVKLEALKKNLLKLTQQKLPLVYLE
jgi:hypothetical protein